MRKPGVAVASAYVLLLGTTVASNAQLAVSANDAKVKLINGKQEVQTNPPADSVTVIDLKANPPKVLAELRCPTARSARRSTSPWHPKKTSPWWRAP